MEPGNFPDFGGSSTPEDTISKQISAQLRKANICGCQARGTLLLLAARQKRLFEPKAAAARAKGKRRRTVMRLLTYEDAVFCDFCNLLLARGFAGACAPGAPITQTLYMWVLTH